MTQFDIESITKTVFSWEIVATGKNGKKKYIGNVIDMLDPPKDDNRNPCCLTEINSFYFGGIHFYFFI